MLTSCRPSAKTLALLLTITAIGSWGIAYSQPERISSRFDPYFQRYAGRWMPDHDWRWLKAQCYQESLLDPEAVSHAGAKGLCQFMPGTWGEAVRDLSVQDIWRPRDQIMASAWYMHRMERVWSGRNRTPSERLPLAQASYNCGPGCVIEAQACCEDERLFPGIAPCLPREAQEYPIRIARWWGLLVKESGG